MNKLRASIKVLTFINIKIFIILSILFSSMFFGTKYLRKIEKEGTLLMCDISNNEEKVITKNRIVNNVLTLNNEILTMSLEKESDFETIEEYTFKMRKQTQYLVDDTLTRIKLINIITQKELIYKKITLFNNREVVMNKVKEKKKIQIVSETTKKGIFKKKKVTYDTTYKSYKEVNQKLYSKEFDRISKINSSEINNLITQNNKLTLDMKLLIDSYTNNQTILGFGENEKTLKTLIKNVKNYITFSFILATVVIALIYLLILDIRKVSKSNKRNKDTVKLLLRKTKDELN